MTRIFWLCGNHQFDGQRVLQTSFDLVTKYDFDVPLATEEGYNKVLKSRVAYVKQAAQRTTQYQSAHVWFVVEYEATYDTGTAHLGFCPWSNVFVGEAAAAAAKRYKEDQDGAGSHEAESQPPTQLVNG